MVGTLVLHVAVKVYQPQGVHVPRLTKVKLYVQSYMTCVIKDGLLLLQHVEVVENYACLIITYRRFGKKPIGPTFKFQES